MVTKEEIAARVRASDEQRIAVRAERAGEVADLSAQLADKRAELDALTAQFATAAKGALEVMSVDELVEFAGVTKADVQAHTPTRATAVRAGSTVRRRGKKPAGKATTGDQSNASLAE